MSSSIDMLPREILHHVFSYLSMPDKLNVSLVCRRWLSVMNCKLLLKNINVIINDNNKVPVLSCMSRNFVNFSFKLIIVDKKYHELFKRFSPQVEYISFEKCEIWKRAPVTFDDLPYDNLKVLKVIDCDLWTLFPSLPNLLELYLSGNSTITDDGLAVLQKSMKHLRTLSLHCNISFDPKAYNRFYARVSYEENPSPYILSLPAIKSFISERANTMKELNLYENLTHHALKDLSSIENLKLNKISLKHCHECTRSLIELFKNQRSLKVIGLNGIIGVNDDIINALCTLIPNVEELHIRCCSVTDESFSNIFQLKQLKKLDIGGTSPSESGICEAASSFASINLQYLTVCGIMEYNISLLIIKCKYLVYLNLAICKVSDELLHFISENFIHLENLNLKRTDITDYGLTGFKGNDDINIILNLPANNCKSLSNLKYLKKLKLNNCEKITDHGIAAAIRFQYLEYLNLCGCEISSSIIKVLLLQNPSIKNIYCDCPIEDPRALKKRSKYCVLFDSETTHMC